MTCRGCPAPAFCRDFLKRQARERRHRFYRDVAYLLTWIVLIMTAPFNPRAWRRSR